MHILAWGNIPLGSFCGMLTRSHIVLHSVIIERRQTNIGLYISVHISRGAI